MSKETKIYFYKPTDKYKEYQKEISTVLNQKADSLRELLLSTEIPKSACINQIGIKLKEESFKSGGHNHTEREMYISKFFRDMKLSCLDSDTRISDSYFQILRCQTNLMNGKCKCPFVSNTVGKILFPHWYDKEK